MGYPIWWGGAAWLANHFVTDHDFISKKVILFAASSSSSLGSSGDDLATMVGTGDW
ncbi:flavodoxin [Bifidobacterium pseudocatenulatum]|uniref:flavodoxin n=1 Tax=Bifidobacterium pseudocatenulatum TaxID=28026 RepID=UPI00232EE5C6|nr:flavodoxin [Bifidobacterium pseudocatenulatum]MDB6507232.1 flavodoxin [Bifidobacterium pseudocatenulatum]